MTRNAAKLAVFDAFFARPDVGIVPITTAVFDRATSIRAPHGFKLGDSFRTWRPRWKPAVIAS